MCITLVSGQIGHHGDGCHYRSPREEGCLLWTSIMIHHVLIIVIQRKSSSVGGSCACDGFFCGIVVVFIVISQLGRFEGVIYITLVGVMVCPQRTVSAARGRVNRR